MFTKTIWTAFLLLSLGLAAYVLYGSQIVAHFASAGGQTSDSELNAPEELLTQLGVVSDVRLTEISGIAASIRNPNTYWVHNDSGNPADVFLISESGQTLLKAHLVGATNVDWEDISVFYLNGRSVVCIGDVGDNRGKRQDCCVYVFYEPEYIADKSGNPVEIEITEFSKLDLEYEDGPRNCEAIAFNNRLRCLYLFQKSIDKDETDKTFGIYKLQFRSKKTEFVTSVAKRVAESSNRIITGAAFASDAKQFVLCDYAAGAYLARPLALSWESQFNAEKSRSIPLPVQRQREAICFTTDGKSVIVVSEYGKQPIWKVSLERVLNNNRTSESKKQ